jgi:2-hydroxychromene-2-carboxylate isomerase
MRIAPLTKARGVSVRWRPFLLGPIFKSQEWDDSPFNLYPAKGRYMWRDLERICGALGLPLVQQRRVRKARPALALGALRGRGASYCRVANS